MLLLGTKSTNDGQAECGKEVNQKKEVGGLFAYKYVGCFFSPEKGSLGTQVLNGHNDTQNTLERCLAVCRQYALFGVAQE